MISESQMRYGSRVRRQGRSRLRLANQESRRRLNLGKSAAGIFSWLTAGIFAQIQWQRFHRLQKKPRVVILSEAKNPSVVLCLYLDRREILRFAQNDKTGLFSQTVRPADLSFGTTKTVRLKSVPHGSALAPWMFSG